MAKVITIYQVTARTKPMDWAEIPRWQVIDFYQTRESAEAKIAEMKADRDWYMNYSGADINLIEVLP